MLETPIETARLRIRRFAPADWAAVYAYASDSAVMAWIPDGPMTEAQAREFAADNAGPEAVALAVVLKDAGRLIGTLAFHPWFAPRTWEIGWVFHPAYHGQGYATEAARALADYAFAVVHIHRLIATCQPQNPASWRVMEKLGMRREGYFQQCIHREDGTWWDEYFYAVLESEWGR